MKDCKARAGIAWMVALIMFCTTVFTGAGQYVFADADTNAGTSEVVIAQINSWDAQGHYYGSDGKPVSGWKTLPDGKLYYFDPSNDNIAKINEYWADTATQLLYKFGADRSAVKIVGVSTWRTLGGKLYYFKEDGKVQTSGYGTYESKLYKFASTGVSSAYAGLYNKYYYQGGVKSVGGFWKSINSKLYYVQKGGKIKTSGYAFYKKKLYKFASSGIAKIYSGAYKSYYYTRGVKQTKYKNTIRKMNNKKIYYFKKDGKVFTGSSWKRFKGKRYYFRKGVALTGWNYVGKYKYYFSGNGILCQNLIKRFGNSWKKKDLTIKVNRAKNCITLYAKDGTKGYTIPVKAFPCSVGKASTPTIKGTFYLSKGRTYRWGKLGSPAMGGYCYGQYCSRISGSFLFHSVLYNKPSKWTLSPSSYNNIGKAASHGCIRLQSVNAKLIYDIARYRTTRVIIYDNRKDAGPFDKPTVKKISLSQRYDPTDPNI